MRLRGHTVVTGLKSRRWPSETTPWAGDGQMLKTLQWFPIVLGIKYKYLPQPINLLPYPSLPQPLTNLQPHLRSNWH